MFTTMKSTTDQIVVIVCKPVVSGADEQLFGWRYDIQRPEEVTADADSTDMKIHLLAIVVNRESHYSYSHSQTLDDLTLLVSLTAAPFDTKSSTIFLLPLSHATVRTGKLFYVRENYYFDQLNRLSLKHIPCGASIHPVCQRLLLSPATDVTSCNCYIQLFVQFFRRCH